MKNKQKSGVARLLEIAGGRKNLLVLSALLAIFHALLALIPYLLMLRVLQELMLPAPDVQGILRQLCWAGLAAAISYALLYCSGIASHIAAYHLLYELRQQMAVKLGGLPLGFINQRNSGALKKINADDIERIENFIAHNIPDFVKGITVPILTICYLFTVDWRMAFTSVIPLLFLAIFIPIAFSTKRNHDLLQKYHASQEEMNSGIVEFVRAMPVMKIFGQSAESFQKYSGAVYRFDAFVKAYMKKSTPPFAIFMSFMSNALLPVLALGLSLYFRQGLTLPVLILFLILGVAYIRPVFALSGMGSQLSLINMGVSRLDELLFAPEPVVTGAKQAPSHADVRFENVSFAYTGENVLHNVSFEAPQGSITALVGPSGAGKSTAAQLIARFWDVQQGAIKIGGTDVRDIPPDELMKIVSFVFQDNFMFQETIYENIRMGMDKTEEEIVAAATAAQCQPFIERLPQGYQTRFGESGVQLSGGEQQRIQLARAILKDAPILILDEATAFSDPENEYLIQQAFSKLILGKTVFVIAHRLSTITDADAILLFQNGHLAAKGTHTELLESSSLYHQMWLAHTRAQTFSMN